MNIVGIVDYEMGNLDSVARAVEECGGTPQIITHPAQLATVHRIILPGVGSFTQAMAHLHQKGFVESLNEQVIKYTIPFLGICLGMQLLGSLGYEGGETPGLGWIDGVVQRFVPTDEDWRIPHIGWNEVRFTKPSPLVENLTSGQDCYFVHSYHLCPRNPLEIVGSTPYAGGFASVVQRANVFGVQFHPEKSQRVGFQILRNFLAV